jgi:iron-sulfur cluster assembly protein
MYVKKASISKFSNLQIPKSTIRKSKNLNKMIFVSDKAKEKVKRLMEESPIADKSDLFLRVSVIGGGCSGLSYKMDFDNQKKPMDQEFEDNGIKVVTDLKSFLYLVNTTLDFSEGLNGKGFYFNNPNASRTCACGESFAV